MPFGNSRVLRDASGTVSAWLEDNCASRAAALSYYTTFSVAPILVIAVAVASLAFEKGAVVSAVLAESHRLLGDDGGALIERLLVAARDQQHRGLAAVLAFATLLLGATSAFAELKDSLDAIWRVPRQRTSGVLALLRARLLSFGLVLTVGFLLLVSLLVNVVLAALSANFARWFGPGPALLTMLVAAVLSILGAGLLFALLFKLLPTVGPSWPVAIRGALLTSLLFLVGRVGIGLYLGNAAGTSSFGAAGSLAVLLIWVYYSSLIFFLGAEYTCVASKASAAAQDRPEPVDGSRSGTSARAGRMPQ